MKKSPLLTLENVSKILDGKTVLHDISLSIEKGESFGFLGPNGAGKTTTMKCILNLLSPDSGTITILGENGLSKEGKKYIGFMPENTYLYKYLTGREFLRFNGQFFHLEKEVLESRITSLIDRVGLSHAGDALLATYSKGMLQRIGLAQAIINEPKLLFLDEPMSGLDPIGRKMVKDLLIDLKTQGTTIFFNSHILSDVESLCDHFAIIHQGEIIADEQIKNLKEPLENYFITAITSSKHGVGNVI